LLLRASAPFFGGGLVYFNHNPLHSFSL
jgi:hypothetical protein